MKINTFYIKVEKWVREQKGHKLEIMAAKYRKNSKCDCINKNIGKYLINQ